MDWLEKMGLTEFGPSAVRGAILGLSGLLLAHAGALSHFGIVYDAATHIITVNLDKVSTVTVAALPALIAGVVKLLQYHGTNIIKSTTGGTPT